MTDTLAKGIGFKSLFHLAPPAMSAFRETKIG
jgi:hypothetical protein